MDAPFWNQKVNQAAQVSLSYDEAIASPCRSCDVLFCCCYLPLQVLPIRNLMELDYVRYLLGFPRLEVGFSMNGQWSVYYAMPCRHFDSDTRLCRVHGTSEKPRTCTAYNEHDCWYYRAISGDSKGFLRFDRHRLEQLLPLIDFDRERNVASVPAWSQMIELCSEHPLSLSVEEIQRGTGSVWPSLTVSDDGNTPPEKTLDELMEDPCKQCEAPCCRYLFFPLPVPKTFMQIDFVKFCLNFPDTECAMSPTSWWLLLRTDCEFFQVESKRCGLYGRSERPLRCVHLNQWDCVQYKQLLYPNSTALRRMGRESFGEVAERIRFDDNGRIIHLPDSTQQ
jgi:hypothetical protein